MTMIKRVYYVNYSTGYLKKSFQMHLCLKKIKQGKWFLLKYQLKINNGNKHTELPDRINQNTETLEDETSQRRQEIKSTSSEILLSIGRFAALSGKN